MVRSVRKVPRQGTVPSTVPWKLKESFLRHGQETVPENWNSFHNEVRPYHALDIVVKDRSVRKCPGFVLWVWTMEKKQTKDFIPQNLTA